VSEDARARALRECQRALSGLDTPDQALVVAGLRAWVVTPSMGDARPELVREHRSRAPRRGGAE